MVGRRYTQLSVARKGNFELLLKANCDPFAETIDGLTPFQMAIEMANDKLVRLFVKKFSVMMDDKSVPETFV